MNSAPRLTIIVPVYNEEKTVVQVMQRLAEVFADAEIIYVNDGSTDQSLPLMEDHKREQDLVISKDNGGKGSAIREGLKHAHGKYTTIQDADLEYDPIQIHTLLKTAEEGHQVVFGSRFLQENPNLYKRFLWGNKVLTAVLNMLFWAKLTDSYTCYKLLPTELFRSLNIKANGFDLEAEIAGKCLRKKIVITEVPITYNPRSIKEGKKIKLSDAWKGVFMMLKIRFGAPYTALR